MRVIYERQERNIATCATCGPDITWQRCTPMPDMKTMLDRHPEYEVVVKPTRPGKYIDTGVAHAFRRREIE